MLSALANPILPIFAIIGVGLFAGGLGLFDIAEAKAINRFALFVAIPALLFSIMARAPISEFDLPSLGVYFIPELIIYALGFCAAYFIFKKPPREALLLGMTACFVNHVLYIRPIAEMLYGESVHLPIAAIVTLDGVLIFGGTLLVLEIADLGRVSIKRILRLLFTHPMLVATFLGIGVVSLNIPIHPGIWTYASFVGSAGAPAALFALGVVLSKAPAFEIGGATITMVSLNLVVHPALVWIALQQFELSSDWKDVLVLFAAGPCGAMAFALALQYDVETQSIAKAVVWSTILSVLTLSLLA